MTRHVLPLVLPGQSVGLLGGSFDPPHQGHVQISCAALRGFALDQLWWLVSPGNPLKAHGPAPLPDRVAAARALTGHPRIHVTDIEAQLGTRYTADTLARLRRMRPDVRFVWLMGADNLVQFDRWQDWRQIIGTVPVGVLARPGMRLPARLSRAARIFRGARLPATRARALADGPAPRWCFVNLPMSPLSSSEIRARRARGGHVAGPGAQG